MKGKSNNDFNGVVISRLSDRMDTYEGEIWWLPLDDTLRQDTFDSVSLR